jgi:transposase
MKRITVPDAETFIAAIQDELSRTREGRYFHRLAVVLHVLRGASTYEASRAFGFSSRTIEYWVNRLASNGLHWLWDGKHPGRPSRLSASQMQGLRKELRRSPRDVGYDQNLWDGVLLSHHLEKNYAISLSVRQCQRLFHQMGFSLQRPRRQASEADPLKQESFKKTSASG